MGDAVESSLLVADSTRMYISITVMGILNGLLAGWLAAYSDVVILNLHLSVWLFLVVWAGATAFFSYKSVPSGVLGTGLYLLAVLVFLAPFAYYIPVFHRAGQLSGSPLVDQLATAFQGLFVWGLVSGLAAIACFWAAPRFHRRAQRFRQRRTKREVTRRASDEEERRL